jgi:hypothetical protein
MNVKVKMHVTNYTFLTTLLYKVFNKLPGSSVYSIATTYVLDGLGFESQQRKIFNFSKAFQAGPMAH